MTTHRYPFEQVADAFDLLYNRIGETLGVVLEFDFEG